MTGADTSVYYLAPKRSITMEKQISDVIDGAVPKCLLFSRTDVRVDRSFAMKQTLRNELVASINRKAVIVWDEYLKSASALKSAIQQYEKEAGRHRGQIMIHRPANGMVLPCEWHTRFDCGMDLIVGETLILLNTYKAEELNK